jgi:hypothetical protein
MPHVQALQEKLDFKIFLKIRSFSAKLFPKGLFCYFSGRRMKKDELITGKVGAMRHTQEPLTRRSCSGRPDVVLCCACTRTRSLDIFAVASIVGITVQAD